MEVFKIKKKEQVTDFRIKKLNVAAYVRVSTEKESQLHSYESMIRYYTDKIEKNNNWNLVKVYSDFGVSGTTRFKRQEFNEMVADAINGKIDLILTKSVSRFARNSVDLLSTVRLLKEKNIGVYFEEENIYTLNLESELLITIMSSVAQKESEEASKKLKYGLKMLHENGVAVIHAPCLGYDHDIENKKLVINKREAKIVKTIFEMYLNGYIISDIAKHMNDKGYKTKFNSSFSFQGVRRILENEVYTGTMVQGKYYVKERGRKPIKNRGEMPMYKIKNHHKAIISEEDFNKVHEMLVRKKNSFLTSEMARERYKQIDTELVGVFRCGFCGRVLPRKTEGRIREYQKYYKCSAGQYFGSIRAHCENSMRMREDVIQIAFIECLKRLKKFDFSKISTVTLAQDDFKKLEKEREIILTKLSEFADKYLKKQINLYDYNQLKKEYEDRLIEINKSIELLETEKQKVSIEKSIENEVKEAEDTFEFSFDFFKRFIKYTIIGGRISYKKDGRLIRFVYRDNKDKVEKPTNEEIIDNAIDSGYNKLKLLLKFKCPVKFTAYEFNKKTGKKELKNIDHVNVRFEYEDKDEKLEREVN